MLLHCLGIQESSDYKLLELEYVAASETVRGVEVCDKCITFSGRITIQNENGSSSFGKKEGTKMEREI
jgi:hypothetical protein